MIEKYTFNELFKRFEPIEVNCSYCGLSAMDNIDDCYFLPLYVKKDSTNLIVYRSVKFAKILIGIPRCIKCKKIHFDAKKKAAIISLSFAIALFAISLYNMITIGPVFTAIGVLLALIGGFYANEKLQERYVVEKDIYTWRDGAETNYIIRDLIISGWSFEPPTP